jgi:probable HAF family extracellular repeat protein
MPTRQLSFFLSLLLTLCLFHDTQAQQTGQIESMKLLTTDTGWAATRNKLFWTTDGGASWKDITPRLNHKHQMVSSIFFLDTSTGWVLLSCSDDRDISADNSCFVLASTADGGATWSVAPEKIAHAFSHERLEDGYGFSGESWLDFVDSQHGWEIPDISTNSANPSAGEMLRTVDGGKTWTPTKETPTSDHFIFVTPTDGWIAGGKDQELFVTHDAGDSWTKVSLPATAGTQPNLGESLTLPVFKSEKEGFLCAHYSVGTVAGPYLTTLVLFVTTDGGKTWRLGRSLPRLPGTFVSAAAESFWVAVSSELRKTQKTELQLYTEGRDGKIAKNIAFVSSSGAAMQLSFLSQDQGWLEMSDRLLATKDSGGTWTDITPGSAHLAGDVMPQAKRGRSTNIVPEPRPGRSESIPSPGSPVSTHLGFEAYNVPPATPTMAAWMSSSPFYDIGIYLQGAKNGHKDPILGSPNGPAWISTVEGQGWGLIPIWVGVQSPCACYKTNATTGACTMAYPSVFSSNPRQDGTNEAKAAVSAANALSLATPIIYKDIENYDGPTLCTPAQQAAAGVAVQAYLSGWDTQLHSTVDGSGNYLAGVYGNPKPAQNDFSQAVPIPDDVWIAKTPSAPTPPSVTIWNLTPLTDGLWPSSQRLHQFLIGQPSANWGGQVLSEPMDYDIDNAPVANANAITKAYTYSSTNIDCPGAISTIPTAMNDMNVGAIINGPGQIGTIVGTYQTSLTSPSYAYQSSGGDCAGFSVFGLTNVQPWGINNLGQIVGYFEDSNGAYHGFVLNSNGTTTQVDYNYNGQTATATYLFGINDAGQAVGWAYSPSTFGYQTFMYYGGQFYPLGVSGGGSFDYTQGYGINGQTTLTGVYYFEPYLEDFELSATPASNGNTITWGGEAIGITPGGSANTEAKGIDANDELAGFYESTACVNTAYQCGFEWGGGPTLTILLYGDDANVAEGINNFAEIVGPYTDSITDLSHGLVWTHQ